jgi:uncharacterized protein YneF (UPF0154 family)
MEIVSLVGVLLVSVSIAGGAAGGAMALVLHLMTASVANRPPLESNSVS